MTLKVSAIITAIAVSKFMNFKEHYKYIDVVFYGADAGKQKMLLEKMPKAVVQSGCL